MTSISKLGGKPPTGPRAHMSDLPFKLPPPPSPSSSPTPSVSMNVPLPECIELILPAQIENTHQGNLKTPYGFIRYSSLSQCSKSESSQEAIRRRHSEEVFHEIISKIQDTFDVYYDEVEDGDEETNVLGLILMDLMDHVGMDGALRYLQKFCQSNEQWYRSTRVRLDSIKGTGKGKAGEDFEMDQDDGMAESVRARHRFWDEERLEVFMRIKAFVDDVLDQREGEQGGGEWDCDKLEKLVEVLRWMKSEAEGRAGNGHEDGESRWSCLVVAPNDHVVKSIHHALQSTQSLPCAYLTSKSIFGQDEAEMRREGPVDGGRMRKVTVDFALAEYNVLVVPAVKFVEWQVSPCHVIHYEPVEAIVARTIPLQWNAMTKKGNRFFVFKRQDGDNIDVRLEKARLKDSYGLRDRPRVNGKIAFPITEGDLRKSTNELKAEAGIVITPRQPVLSRRELEVLEQTRLRKAAKRARKAAKNVAFQLKRDEAAAKGLPPPKRLTRKQKQKVRREQEMEVTTAAELEMTRNEKPLSRKERLQRARDGKVLAVGDDVGDRRSTLRSAAGRRTAALGTVDLTRDVGPMKDDGSEQSAVWSATDDDDDRMTSPAKRPVPPEQVASVQQEASVGLDEPDEPDEPGGPVGLEELDEKDVGGFVPALPYSNDLLDEETISMVLEDQQDLQMEDSNAEEEDVQDGPSRCTTSAARESEAGAVVPFVTSIPGSSNLGESSTPLRGPSAVTPDWRVYTQEELGLPELGLIMPRKGASAVQNYTGPSGRELLFEREWNANRDHHVKNTCYSWPQLSNSASTARLSPKSAADIFKEVQTYHQGAFDVQSADPEVLGAQKARRLWVDLPPHMITGPIVADSGDKGKRGMEILHFTFVAALYMAGWLDHGFNFLYTRPTLGTGDAWPSPVPRPALRLASPPSDSSEQDPSESHAGNTTRGSSHGNAGDAQEQAGNQSNSRPIKGLPAPKWPNRVSIQPKKPKFWNGCKSAGAGAFCAMLCRIKVSGSTQRFRTICILTKSRFSIPMGRPLPTCKAMPTAEVVLAAGQDIVLDQFHWKAAHDYTLALFSIPRGRTLHAIHGDLPYFVLPMSYGWQAADEATSEITLKEAANVTNNVAWNEVFAGLKSKTRVLSGFETGGQGLASLAEEALYSANGSKIPYEVQDIVRDDESRAKAQSRASGSGPQVGRDAVTVAGPVFVIRPLPEVWSSGPQTSAAGVRTVTVSPKHEPIFSFSKSIYISAHMLPWIMWTIDGLLLAQEVNFIYLKQRADLYDVLAALSTTASGRSVDCEVLEFAGDTYWKLAATAYFYYASPHRASRELGEQVRSVTDNAPLALGLQECGASDYILNAPINPSAFTPYGCGIWNVGDPSISYPQTLSTTAGRKAIADASEALAGAVGKLKDHELIQQVCTALQPGGLPSAISWQDLTYMPALDFGSINATLLEVDEIYASTGHIFTNRSMLNMILRNRPRGEIEQGAAARLNFLGTAVFEYLLMAYLVDQGRIRNLGPGQLTRWRNSMYSHIAMATLWVASGLSKHVGFQTPEFNAKIKAFEDQLKKTTDTRTESTMAWTRIANPPRAENHVHSLFGGVLIDSGWSFDAARAVFNKFCLPFFARFVGSYDPVRLAPLPDNASACVRLAKLIRCSRIETKSDRGRDGVYRATVSSHDRVLGDASSVYESAAIGFAYRDAFAVASDRSFDRNACPCHQPVGNPNARSGVVDLTREEQPSGPVTRSRGSPPPIMHDAESDDDFEIIDDPKTVLRVGQVGQVGQVASGSKVRASSDAGGSDRGQNKKRKL